MVRPRSPSGLAKAAGVALCLAGVLTIALYTGPSMSPVNHHRAFAGAAEHHEASGGGSKGRWIKGTFLMLLSNTTWSLWIVLQASLLKEYPNKLLSTLVQCLLSTAQSFLLAVAVERDPAAWKLRLDVGLLAVGYSVSAVQHAASVMMISFVAAMRFRPDGSRRRIAVLQIG